MANKQQKYKKLDSYSILITSKYFNIKEDYINIMCVCKKYKELTEKLHFNPISVTSTTLFPHMETQYLYTPEDKPITTIKRFEIWYNVSYSEYLNNKRIKSSAIMLNIQKQTKEFGEEIPLGVNKLSFQNFQYSGSVSDVIIPNHITSIGSHCFDSCENLTKIVISDKVKRINNGSFIGCISLKSIVIPNSIESIGNNCFYDCQKLKNIHIPDSVTSIEYECFKYCTSLKSIILPSSLCMLENSTFDGCSSLNETILPISVTSIGDLCFSNCTSLTTIKLPSLLLRLGKKCFSKCKLQEIRIPYSVKSIGIDCFSKCTTLSHLQLPLDDKHECTFAVSYEDSIFYKQYDIKCTNIVLTKKDIKNEYTRILREKSSSNKFIVPNGVVEIENDGFCKKSFRNFVFPTTLTSLGNNCFRGCTNITSFDIPTSLKSLPYGCFSDCSSLKNISVPTSIVSIGDYCFVNCSSLTSISIPNSVQSIGIHCFNRCEQLTQVSVPLDSNNKYPFKISFSGSKILKRAGIYLTRFVFDNIDHVQYRKVPKYIPLILDMNQETKERIVPDNTVSLKSLYLSKGNKFIFLPNRVTRIGNECFKDYTKLKSISIKTSVKQIGKHLIDGCTRLTELNYEGDWNNIIVSYDDHLRYKSKNLLFNSIEYTNDDKRNMETMFHQLFIHYIILIMIDQMKMFIFQHILHHWIIICLHLYSEIFLNYEVL